MKKLKLEMLNGVLIRPKLNIRAEEIKINAISHFVGVIPKTMGNVLDCIFKSPLMSSMSLINSLAVVNKTQKTT